VRQPQPVVVQGFHNRAQAVHAPAHDPAQVVRNQPAQVVHTQVVQSPLKAYDFSRHHSQKGVVENKIHHKTQRTDKWMTLSAVNRRIADYTGRVEKARQKFQEEPTQSNKGVLENNEGWLAYWVERRGEFFEHQTEGHAA
jgi:hypothetical protein